MAEQISDAKSLLKSHADTQRPLIHHLSADNSWLIQIPRRDGHPRPYFNILIDAWLRGSQIEFFRVFHEQAHTVPSAFQTMAEVEAYVHDIEGQACHLRDMDAQPKPSTGYIDVAACCLRGTDMTQNTSSKLTSTSRILHSCPLSRAIGAKLVYLSSRNGLESAVSPRQRTSKASTRDLSSHSIRSVSTQRKPSCTRRTGFPSSK
jgi:hypothetical protein